MDRPTPAIVYLRGRSCLFRLPPSTVPARVTVSPACCHPSRYPPNTPLYPTITISTPIARMFLTSVFGLAAFFISLVVLRVLRFFWRCATSPLHQLPGPVSTSWLYGNVREFTEAGQSVLWDHWTEIYGNTFKFSTFFNVSPPCLLSFQFRPTSLQF